jgi:hypothetical protein
MADSSPPDIRIPKRVYREKCKNTAQEEKGIEEGERE